MEIVAALFVEGISFRQVDGPSTRIDITGAFFSFLPPSYPTELEPHLIVLVRCQEGGDSDATLDVVFLRDGDQIGSNRQEFSVDPGKFGYRLVKARLSFPGPATVEARCTLVESGSSVTVPLTALG